MIEKEEVIRATRAKRKEKKKKEGVSMRGMDGSLVKVIGCCSEVLVRRKVHV